MLNIFSNVLSSAVKSKKLIAAGFIYVTFPDKSTEIIPSLICNKIASVWLFCLFTSSKFCFNSSVIVLIVFVNLSSLLFFPSSKYFISFSLPNFPVLSTISDNESVIFFNILLIKTNVKIAKNIIAKIHTISTTDLLFVTVCATSFKSFWLTILLKLYKFTTHITDNSNDTTVVNIIVIFNLIFFIFYSFLPCPL